MLPLYVHNVSIVLVRFFQHRTAILATAGLVDLLVFGGKSSLLLRDDHPRHLASLVAHVRGIPFLSGGLKFLRQRRELSRRIVMDFTRFLYYPQAKLGVFLHPLTL
jgi:hypothetical protein